jgi:ATP citrate (pro-S)-lyase
VSKFKCEYHRSATRLEGRTDASSSRFGPESHITNIVPLALGITPAVVADLAPVPNILGSLTPIAPSSPVTGVVPLPTLPVDNDVINGRATAQDGIVSFESASTDGKRPWFRPFDETTRSLVYGLQPRAIQGMLDFDYACGRETPSVAAMIYPFGGHHVQKFYWGTKETLLPVFASVADAVKKCPEADIVVNFASSRSVYSSTLECLEFPSIKAIAIIAEGVPERHAREILWAAKRKGVTIIGPATVGGIKPGCFRIGNTGG